MTSKSEGRASKFISKYRFYYFDFEFSCRRNRCLSPMNNNFVNKDVMHTGIQEINLDANLSSLSKHMHLI